MSTREQRKRRNLRMFETLADALTLQEAGPRPQTRGDCRGGQRPCPWVSCRYHLAHGRLPSPHRRAGHAREQAAATRLLDALEERALEIIGTGAESCALDVADRGEHTLEEVATALGTTKERVRLVEVDALDRLARRIGKVEL